MNKIIEARKVSMGDYTLVHWESMTYVGPRKVEELYKAKYIGEVSLPASGGQGWANTPVMLFYTEKAHPEGSNWFGLYHDPFDETLMITNGIGAVFDKNQKPVIYTGLVNETKREIYYSAFRHDYQSFEDEYMIDGGRDYTKHSLKGRLVEFYIDKDRFKLCKDCEELS